MGAHGVVRWHCGHVQEHRISATVPGQWKWSLGFFQFVLGLEVAAQRVGMGQVPHHLCLVLGDDEQVAAFPAVVLPVIQEAVPNQDVCHREVQLGLGNWGCVAGANLPSTPGPSCALAGRPPCARV